MSATKVTIKHYVQYFYPDRYSSKSDMEIDHRDPSLIKLPYGCNGFVFYDRTVIDYNEEQLVGEKRNFSERYVKGKEYSLQEFISAFPNEMDFAMRMRHKKFKRIAVIQVTHFLPLQDEDVMLKD